MWTLEPIPGYFARLQDLKPRIELASGFRNGDIVLICGFPDKHKIVVVQDPGDLTKKVGLPGKHLVPLSPLETLAATAIGIPED